MYMVCTTSYMYMYNSACITQCTDSTVLIIQLHVVLHSNVVCHTCSMFYGNIYHNINISFYGKKSNVHDTKRGQLN